MPRWKDFELLAKQIYDELDGSAEVTWDDHIMGHQTQIPRQIDVSIKWDDEGTSRLAVVQAKDWKARADITHVGEFASVIRDVKADKGIMICRGGFSKNAKKYAREPRY